MIDTSVAGEQRLQDECRRLVERLTSVNVGWFGARSAAGTMTREAQLRALVRTVAELGRAAGTGAPPGVTPHELGVHALADQVMVLVRDIVLAPRSAAVVTEAADAVSGCYDALWGSLTP